jgi:probable DNA metabolism protein
MSGQGNKYTYDGTFEGYLCAVLAALRSGKVPAAITDRRSVAGNDGLADVINISTSLKDAQYLYTVISARSSAEVQQMASDYFLTDSAGLEINLYKMIFCSLKYGARIAEDYSSTMMNGIQMAIRDLYREAQSLLKDLDFYLGEEAACCVINPKNSVLPVIRQSILKRRDIDSLIVYDKRHHLLLERYSDQNMLLDISDFPIPEFRDPRAAYECLWPFVRDRRFDVRNIPTQKKSGSTIEPLWLKAS